MKIVFLSGLYPPHTKGGGEISAYLIAEGLKARGHEVEVITEGNSHLGLLRKPLFERRQTRKIAAKLKEILPKADIVHAHDFRSALALSELGLPNAVVTVRDYAPICGTTNNILADGSRCHCTWDDVRHTRRFQEVGFPRNYARAWQYWHNTPYRKKAFAKLSHQIFISHAQQREIEESLNLDKTVKGVIYNPISKEYLENPVSQGRNGSVLYVGRLEDYKGVRFLLRVWREIARGLPHVHLTLIGEGSQKAEYERWVEQNGLQYRVTFSDQVPSERLRAVYDEAEIVVAPHAWIEPFGRTTAEAMARGKVVVAAKAGGPGEIIRHQKTGILFERNSETSLKKALEETLRLRPYDRKEIGSQAQIWVREHLTQEIIAKQYERFYQEILDKT